MSEPIPCPTHFTPEDCGSIYLRNIDICPQEYIDNLDNNLNMIMKWEIVQWSALVLRIRKLSGSNFGPEVRFSLFSSVPAPVESVSKVTQL
jgi:hypothetical protein